MRLSLNITNFSWPGGPTRLAAELGRIARQADEGGLDTVWVVDHLIQAEPGTDPTQEMLEAYTTLGYLAATTSRVRLGTMVTAVTFRAPALLVKAVTTLDVLSGGRAWLGLGAGYHQAEADMMGLPLPPTAERFEHLEDTLRLATQMWSGDETAFAGAHHRLARPLNSPNPITRPHPPILIGAWERRRRCDSSPATPRPATCPTYPTAARQSETSSPSSPSTAPQSAGPTARSTKPSAPGSPRARRPTRSRNGAPGSLRWASSTSS